MTCIVGLVHEGRVFIGGDSAAVGGWRTRPSAVSKVFVKGPFAIGYTSSFRMGQILEHYLEVPEQAPGTDDMAFMVRVFVEQVRQCLKERGFSKVENNQEEGGTFMVGYRGRLYLIWDDYQVSEYQDGIAACGSGEAYALAALHALRARGLSPETRVLSALDAAQYFNIGVRGPFMVIEAPAGENADPQD